MDIVERLKAWYAHRVELDTVLGEAPHRNTDLVKESADEIERLQADLAAAQAREAKLRDALKEAVGWNWLDEDAPQIPLIDEASALPNDDTALRERLNAEREKIAHLFLEVDHAKAAAAIRALED